MTEIYKQYLEEVLMESYKELFKGKFYIPSIEIFKITIENEGKTILMHAIESRVLGSNARLEEAHVNALIKLEEMGALETLDSCDLVTMYEVYDLGSHKTLLALWSYKLRE